MSQSEECLYLADLAGRVATPEECAAENFDPDDPFFARAFALRAEVFEGKISPATAFRTLSEEFPEQRALRETWRGVYFWPLTLPKPTKKAAEVTAPKR